MKRNTIFSLLQICNMLTNIGGSLITPFFPPFALEKGVSSTTLGFIISANPIGSFITSLLIGKLINDTNRKIFICLGLGAQGFGLLLFASLYWINNLDLVISVSTIGRFIGGVGCSSFMTPFYAYVPLLFPKEVEKKIGISEFISGFAMLLGPVFGSVLYSLGGYTLPFIFFGTCDVAMIFFLIAFIGSGDMNAQQRDIKYSSLDEEEKLSYLQTICSYPVIMQLLMVYACNICFTYFQPIISEFYLDTYNIPSSQVGYLMSIVTAGYAIGSYIVGHVKRKKRLMVCLGCVVFGMTYLFIGPSKKLTGLNHHLWITLTSQAFMGIFTAPVYIPAVPILNEALHFKYPRHKLQTANIASAIFTSGMAAGQLTGPIVSGAIVDKIGFDAACADLGLFLIFLAIIYIPMIFIRIPEHKLSTEGDTVCEPYDELDKSKIVTKASLQQKTQSVNELGGIMMKIDIDN